MPNTTTFYSRGEAGKPAAEQVYHNNSVCPTGAAIGVSDRLNGHNQGSKLCGECVALNAAGR